MLSGYLAVLVLQLAPGVFGSPAGNLDLQYRTVNYSDYNQLRGLVATAHSTAVSLLQGSNGTCTRANVKTRREWDSFTADERKDYTRAVRCLQSAPAITPSELGSGIKTRYDDFVATHMNQTQTIHYTGTFLTWHRYFIHLYEQALREECAYTGTLPYWNWPKTAITGLHASPIFDGSATSMSGDGDSVANQSAINIGGNTLDPFWIPSGSGGGCVTSGPFANYTVNLGPVSLDLPGGSTATNPHNDTGIFSWNPRCLKRDLTDYVNQNFANASSVLNAVLRYDDVAEFQLIFQGIQPSVLAGGTTIGVHGGGHFSLGGDPGRDLFVSPGEPAFYLHHTMIDRVYWLWQMQDPETRVLGHNVVAGTNTFLNEPASANTTVDDWIQYGYATGPPRQIKDLLSTTAGPFCYVYE